MPIELVPIEQDRTMKIKIKDLNTESMVIAKKGIELEFRETNEEHTGDLIITPTKNIFGIKARLLSMENR
jgi:ribosomal protein L11